CTRRASSGRPIWPLAPSTSARPGRDGRHGGACGASGGGVVIRGRITCGPKGGRGGETRVAPRHPPRWAPPAGLLMLNLLLALPFAAALAIALAPGPSRRTTAWMAAAAPLLGLALLAGHTPGVMDGQVPGSSVEWLPQAGLAL